MISEHRRVLVALKSGPLYRPTLELVVGISERQSREAVVALSRDGLIEIAREVGPATYRITAAGEEAIS
jgi:hypothetical protein